MYGLYFLLCFTFIRNFHFESMFLTWLNESPNVDRIYMLCQDIRETRVVKEYGVEEYLFSKLLFLFRCNETFVEFTRF